MMDDFFAVMSAIWGIFDIPMTVYGFTFTFKSVFIFSICVGLIGTFIGVLLRGAD